jgi:hypothetical protein
MLMVFLPQYRLPVIGPATCARLRVLQRCRHAIIVVAPLVMNHWGFP